MGNFFSTDNNEEVSKDVAMKNEAMKKRINDFYRKSPKVDFSKLSASDFPENLSDVDIEKTLEEILGGARRSNITRTNGTRTNDPIINRYNKYSGGNPKNNVSDRDVIVGGIEKLSATSESMADDPMRAFDSLKKKLHNPENHTYMKDQSDVFKNYNVLPNQLSETPVSINMAGGNIRQSSISSDIENYSTEDDVDLDDMDVDEDSDSDRMDDDIKGGQSDEDEEDEEEGDNYRVSENSTSDRNKVIGFYSSDEEY